VRIWTRGRAKDRGYDIDSLCSGGQLDTAHHRLYTCIRAHVVAARAESEVNAVFARAAIDNDEEMRPPLQSGAEVHMLDGDGNDAWCTPETTCDVLGSSATELEFVLDGSGSAPPLDALRRLGWAAALLDPQGGKPLRATCWAVPDSPPQRPAMAEHLALAFVGKAADRHCDVYADYTAVVRDSAKRPHGQLRPRAHDGCVKLFGQLAQ
ncbi:unnamed protein product, partial [Prorocentrum cordatum]